MSTCDQSPVFGANGEAPAIPPGRRLYAIGDIHGRFDLLQTMTRKIEADLARGAFDEAVTVFLGDYIDRSMDSAGVVDFLASGRFPTPIVALRGNHEAELLRFLDDADVLERWRRHGGLETLASYGVDIADAMRGRGYEAARRELRAKLPATHRKFLDDTRASFGLGDYFFCHAGVRPGTPLARQSDSDLLSIREEFTSHRGQFEKIIVHGHSPARAPFVAANRVGIDTGAYFTGTLTCLGLQGEVRRFFST